MTRREHHLAIAGFVFFVVLILSMIPRAHPRDLDGRHADSPHRDWVKSLHSPAGAWCCDVADGEDADWRSHAGGYQVRANGVWVDVPADAVIAEPNRIGRTLVWFVLQDGGRVVKCFLPGSGA